MPTHTVILTDPARGDLAEIGDYIALDSPEAADRVCDDILASLRSLANLPGRNKQVGVSRKRRVPIYRLVVNPYIVYYRIETDLVYILNILHGKRRQPRRFE
jgi:plasmid stabilization system protein ParE